MEALIRHLVEPAVANPEAVDIQAVEGDDVLLLTVSVDAADREILDDDRTMRSIRTIVSAAAGSQKASVQLAEDEDEDADEDADAE
jgi:predicted RNA-binding protein YlqC (UPF0109 family)